MSPTQLPYETALMLAKRWASVEIPPSEVVGMTPAELDATLDALGISRARFGRLVQVNKDTPTNWAKGRTEIPGAVVLLLRLLASGAVTIEQLEGL